MLDIVLAGPILLNLQAVAPSGLPPLHGFKAALTFFSGRFHDKAQVLEVVAAAVVWSGRPSPLQGVITR